MNKFIIVFALFAVTMGAPSESPSKRSLPATEYSEERSDRGEFTLRYETAEGTVVSERGRLVPAEDGGEVLVTDGEVSYVGPDGVRYLTRWSAGLDGVKAEGAHLPVPVEPLPVPVVVEPSAPVLVSEAVAVVV